MLRVLFASFLFLSGSLLHAEVYAGPDCSIQDASTADGAMWLLCRDGQVLSNGAAADSWTQRPLPIDEQLRAIRFLDAERGFVAGDGGTLLVTADGGEQWSVVETSAEENLTSIYSVGESVWIAGWGGVILHSDDGGQSWRQQETGTAQGLDDIYFTDPSHGWAVGWVGTILRTTDGGESWMQVRAPDVHWSLNGVHFLDRNVGIAVGFGGQLARSEDGGKTWKPLPPLVTRSLTSVYFDNQGHGWITTADGMLASEDGGQTWTHVPVEEQLFLVKVLERDGSLWAIGGRDIFKRNESDAAGWEKTSSFVGELLRDLRETEQS